MSIALHHHHHHCIYSTTNNQISTSNQSQAWKQIHNHKIANDTKQIIKVSK